MKKTILLLLLTAIGVGLFFYIRNSSQKINLLLPPTKQMVGSSPTISDVPVLNSIAQNLDTPWGLVFLPDRSMLVTERPGRVRLINAQQQLQKKPIATLAKVKEIGEGGLLGIEISPSFETDHYVYLYYTYDENGGDTLNRVVRMKYEDDVLDNEEIIVDKIPGASNHNGGRIKFGPDGYLYVTTGDAENPSQAQQTDRLGGKILRVKADGKIPTDNPFKNAVYSYGHRNPQGLTWLNGELWSTEHGRSGVLSGLDELNKIEKGKNYGWPIIQGDDTKGGMERANLNSGSTTWAPGGAAARSNSIFFGALRGQTLYEAIINGGNILLKEHLKGELGRIRDVVVGPDSMLYITTSNQDGRGTPHENDDQVIRVNPSKL